MMKNMHVIIYLLVVSFIITMPALADDNLMLQHTGYAKPQTLIFTIANLGKNNLQDITVYVDGKIVENINTLLTKNTAIELQLTLQPGKHIIRIVSGEYFHTLDIDVPTAIISLPEIQIPRPDLSTFNGKLDYYWENYKIIFVFLALTLIILIIILILSIVPKLIF